MIIIPFHMNPRAVNPILVTVFPKKRRRTKTPIIRAIFWNLFICPILCLKMLIAFGGKLPFSSFTINNGSA